MSVLSSIFRFADNKAPADGLGNGPVTMPPVIAAYQRWAAYRFVALLLLGTVAAILLLEHRNFYLITNPQLWGEDLTVYLLDDLALRAQAILRPHNGSNTVSGRLVAYFAGFFPIAATPRIYALAYLCVFPLLFYVIFKSSAFRGYQAFVAALFVFIVPVDSEVFNGMLYLHWVLGPVIGLALYEAFPRGRHYFAIVFAYAIVAISSPLAAMAAPFAVVKWYRERGTYAASLLIMSVASGIFMAVPMLARIKSDTSITPLSTKLQAIADTSYVWATGRQHVSTWLAVAIGIATAALVGGLLAASFRHSRRAIFYLLCCGACLLVVCLWVSSDTQQNQFASSARYYYVPAVLLLWTLLSLRDGIPSIVKIPVLVAAMSASYLSYVRPASDVIADVHWAEMAHCFETSRSPCVVTANPGYLGRYLVPSRAQVANGEAGTYVIRERLFNKEIVSGTSPTGQIRLVPGTTARETFTIPEVPDTATPYLIEFLVGTPEGRPVPVVINWAVFNVGGGRRQQLFSGAWSAATMQNYETVGLPIVGSKTGDKLEIVISSAPGQAEGPVVALPLFGGGDPALTSPAVQDGKDAQVDAYLHMSVRYRFYTR